MRILLRKSDVLGLPAYGGNMAALARAFTAAGYPVSKVSVFHWGEYVPDLRARALLEMHPELKDHVVDPATGLSLVQMRERLAAQPQAAGQA